VECQNDTELPGRSCGLTASTWAGPDSLESAGWKRRLPDKPVSHNRHQRPKGPARIAIGVPPKVALPLGSHDKPRPAPPPRYAPALSPHPPIKVGRPSCPRSPTGAQHRRPVVGSRARCSNRVEMAEPLPRSPGPLSFDFGLSLLSGFIFSF